MGAKTGKGGGFRLPLSPPELPPQLRELERRLAPWARRGHEYVGPLIWPVPAVSLTGENSLGLVEKEWCYDGWRHLGNFDVQGGGEVVGPNWCFWLPVVIGRYRNKSEQERLVEEMRYELGLAARWKLAPAALVGALVLQNRRFFGETLLETEWVRTDNMADSKKAVAGSQPRPLCIGAFCARGLYAGFVGESDNKRSNLGCYLTAEVVENEG